MALAEPPSADPWEQLDRIEPRIRDDFGNRVHNFRIQAFDDGLVLEGRTRTYYARQAVLQPSCPRPIADPRRPDRRGLSQPSEHQMPSELNRAIQHPNSIT